MEATHWEDTSVKKKRSIEEANETIETLKAAINSLAMVLVPHSSTNNAIHFEVYENAIHGSFDETVGEPRGRRLVCEVQSKVASIRSQA